MHIVSVMVKEGRKKIRRGAILPITRRRKDKARKMTGYKQAFFEIRILFLLKEYTSLGISKLTDLAGGHTYDVNTICENLIGKKLVTNLRSGAKSSTYMLTEKGRKACKAITDYNKLDENYGLKYFTIIPELLEGTYQPVDFS